jgi:hypothetical protein
MIKDLVQSKKLTINKAISYFISEGLVAELSNLKMLPEEKTKDICETLGIKTIDNDIFYNNYNIVFDNPDTHEEFKHYLKISEDDEEKNSLTFRLEIPQMNVNIWAYSRQKNKILDNILGE